MKPAFLLLGLLAAVDCKAQNEPDNNATNPPVFSIASISTCDTPSNLSITPVNLTDRQVVWSAVSGATGYDYVVNSPYFASSVVINRALCKANPGQPITVSVRAICPDDQYSQWVSVTEVLNTTGIKNAPANTEIKVYPNPATHTLNLEFANNINNASVMITDVMGKVMYTAPVNTSKLMVDMRAWPAAIYQIKYNNGTSTQTIKVVKE